MTVKCQKSRSCLKCRTTEVNEAIFNHVSSETFKRQSAADSKSESRLIPGSNSPITTRYEAVVTSSHCSFES